MDNVWVLESSLQQTSAQDLVSICESALLGCHKSQNYLKKLWPECSWQTIKERLNIEGSAWCVWWMDGVNQHLINLQKC